LLDQILAAIDLFLAAETLLGAVVLSVDEQPDEAIGTRGYVGGQPKPEQVKNFKLDNYHRFDQLFNQVVAILRASHELEEDKKLFKWGKLERLQKARNDAQHGAKAPHPSDLPELITTTEKLIGCILELHFSALATTIMVISLTKLISDEVLRQYMEHAEEQLTQGNYKACTLLVRIAFLLGRKKRRFNWWKDEHRIIDDYDTPRRISEHYGCRPLDGQQSRLLDAIVGAVLPMPHLFDNWVLGLDEVDRARLSELTPRLTHQSQGAGVSPSDEVLVVNILDEILSSEEKWKGPHFRHVPSKYDCLWALDYTTDTLIRWQKEQHHGYSAVDSRYLAALPTLKQCH
jgi:hypothetical protein